MKKRLIVGILAGLLTLLMSVTLVSATMPTSLYSPDVSGPTIISIDIYKNYLTTDGVLVVANYRNEYSAERQPVLSIDRTFIGSIVPAAGGAALSTVAPYPYYNSGYGYGIFAFYFEPTTAPTWAGDYAVRLFGSPTGYNWLDTTASTAVTSAQYWDNAVYAAETVDINDADASDVTLPYDAVNKAIYVGGSQPFDKVLWNLGTAGAGVWTITWEYYNGTWTALADVVDDTTNFRAAAGNYYVSYTMPTDWETVAVNSSTQYWIRGRVSQFTSQTVAPLGTRAYLNCNNTAPTTQNVVINWHDTTTLAAASALVGANVISWGNTLSTEWSVALTASGASGTTLSAYGVQYFTNAIPGLAQACPSIFPTGLQVPVVNATYTPPAATSLPAAVEAESPIDTTGFSAWLMGPGHDSIFRVGAFTVLWLVLVFIVAKQTQRMDMAMYMMLPLVPIGAALGGVNWTYVIILTVLVVFAALFLLIVQKGAT